MQRLAVLLTQPVQLLSAEMTKQEQIHLGALLMQQMKVVHVVMGLLAQQMIHVLMAFASELQRTAPASTNCAVMVFAMLGAELVR